MTWFRSDDGFPEHPKVDALAAHFGRDWQRLHLALAAWHLLGCDCAARRTDGRFDLPRAQRVLRAPPREVERALSGLVAVGLLTLDEGVYTYHDWAQYQPTRAQLDAERAAKTQRQSRWRAAKATRVDGAVDASTPSLVDASRDGAVDAAPSRPVPSRPTPTPPTPSPGVSAGEGGAPRLGAVEHRGFRADELAALLRERARGRVLAAGADGRVLVQLQQAMDDAARGGATRASYETLADWYAAGSQSWRTRKPLGLAELATTPGTLAEHIEAAQRWHDEGRPAITHGDPKRRGPAPPSRFDGRDYEGDARRLAEAEAEAERAFNALPG
jgi:hypothetical protein